MSTRAGIASIALMASVSGCVTQQQFLAQVEPSALATVESRARFELSCPGVTTSILSQKVIQPVWIGGIERAEYTVGASGCGKKAVYIAICPSENNCNALSDTGRVAEGED